MVKATLPATMPNNTGITLVVCSRRQSPALVNTLKHYIRTSGIPKHRIQIIKETRSIGLSKSYNQALQDAHYNVVCCLHDDLRFARNSHWAKQVLDAFKHHTFAALSAAGSASLSENGVFWHHREHMVGRVRHLLKPLSHKKSYLSHYSQAFPHPLPVAVLDGLFLALHRPRLYQTAPFDERFAFHFYDLSFSLNQSHSKNSSCGVLTRLKITHKSVGKPDTHYLKARRTFVQFYQNRLPYFLPPRLEGETQTITLDLPLNLHIIYIQTKKHEDSEQNTKTQDLFQYLSAHGFVRIHPTPVSKVSLKLIDLYKNLSKNTWIYIHHENIVISLAQWSKLYDKAKQLHQQKRLCLLSPRVHYADTQLLYHRGIKNNVCLGMNQPYNYSLLVSTVESVLLHCALLPPQERPPVEVIQVNSSTQASSIKEQVPIKIDGNTFALWNG